jgi:RNA polymerase sigma-70 factor, ECF subfamily
LHTTSISLLQRLRQPVDQDAWARFVSLYTPLLYFWAQRTGFTSNEADDLVQEVFTVLVQKLPQFDYDPQRTFRGWLRTVAVNKWRERMRRRADPTVPYAAADLSANDPAEKFWEDEYRAYLVRRALELMKADFPDGWQACWDVVVENKSPVEVAAQLGVTVGAVRAAKFRVLSRLREEFRADGLNHPQIIFFFFLRNGDQGARIVCVKQLHPRGFPPCSRSFSRWWPV